MDDIDVLKGKISALESSQEQLKYSIVRLEAELAENRVRRLAETHPDPCWTERMKKRERFL